MKPKNNPSKRSFSDYVSQSLILPFFYRIAVFLYRSMRESAVGRFFCSYDRENAAMKSGILARLRERLRLSDRILRPLRFAVASQFDNSAILNLLRACLDRLAGMSLGTYGLSCLFFSLFSSIMYVLRHMTDKTTSSADLVIAAAVLLIGICLVASHSHLSDALCQSRLTAFFLFRICGVNEEYFRRLPHTHGATLAAALVGSLFGCVTAVISPLFVFIGLIGILAAFLVYKIPEAGVVAVLFLAPFLPTMVLVALMMFLIACFFVKYLRGKRTVRVGWLDLTVILFMAAMLFAGLFSASPADSVYPVMVFLCFMCGYFLVVNLIRSAEWIDRCLWAVLSSAVLVALYGIYQNFFTVVDTTWQDTEMFSDISGRVVSTLENPNVLAEYLIMILPVALAGFLISPKASQKLCYLFVGGILGACLIFTWSRGAWLGLLIAVMVFLLMYSKKVMVVGLFGVLAVPFLPFVLPDSILNRFLSIGNLGDTSTSYRVHIWEGVLSMLGDHFLGGIGVGTEVFGEVYPRYALSGIESAPHSHNLYLQILVETGILGFALFLVFLFTFAKRNFTFYAKPLPQRERVLSAALFCGILAVLAQGMTDYIWYNYRVFLVFWLLIGLCHAVCRTTESDNRDLLRRAEHDRTAAEAAELDLSSPQRKRSTK
ncbi:MAG: O-antigen ligase family protein [Clostridia bacterium]|nr:O-antigen ligase family protein [Clostridia bacterium]